MKHGDEDVACMQDDYSGREWTDKLKLGRGRDAWGTGSYLAGGNKASSELCSLQLWSDWMS